jgi:uncharacterized linocin/CFP29 family protein
MQEQAVGDRDLRVMMGGATGKWAGERLLKALKEGRPISPSELRTLDVLRRDDWILIDHELVAEARVRLRVVADLIELGLTKKVANAMGKTVYEYQKITDMDPAVVSLDGVTRSEGDHVTFVSAQLPIPITHKDFYLNLRAMVAASTGFGDPLDTTHVRAAGRQVAEAIEDMTINGGKTFGGLPVYGLRTHPNRVTASLGTNGAWSAAAKTGDNILTDLQTMIAGLEAVRFFGPYELVVPGDVNVKLAGDFKLNSDRSIRERILANFQIERITVADKMPTANVVLFQETPDVIQMLDGEPMQTVQWDTSGGFQVNFKAFQIMVPLIRSDAGSRCGVFHMS